MVEIEIGALVAQWLGRRIESIEQLAAETVAWEQQGNAAGARSRDVHNRKGPRQNGPGLFAASAQLRSNSKSQTTCRGTSDPAVAPLKQHLTLLLGRCHIAAQLEDDTGWFTTTCYLDHTKPEKHHRGRSHDFMRMSSIRALVHLRGETG
jgi:hypothetical protein